MGSLMPSEDEFFVLVFAWIAVATFYLAKKTAELFLDKMTRKVAIFTVDTMKKLL